MMSRGYALKPADVDELQSQVEDLLRRGFLEEVPGDEHPQVVSPAFWIGKADGGRRFVVDYSKLNKLLQPLRCHYP